jgi:hypothetical protein
MSMHPKSFLVPSLVILVVSGMACGSSRISPQADAGAADAGAKGPPPDETSYPGPQHPEDSVPPPPLGPLCEAKGTGNLTGVALTIRSSKCTYYTGEHATFHIELVVDDTVPTIHVPQSLPCGVCFEHSTDPKSFFFTSISGKSTSGKYQSYCLCDNGCCAGEEAAAIKPNAIHKTIDLEWSGNTYSGPSDTGQKEGFPFLPGRYHVYAEFNGFDQGRIDADLPIDIISSL